jgi:hypothetical protein
MKKSLYTLFFLYLFFGGCNFDNYRYSCLQFIKKHNHEDFSKFKNIGLAIRSYGRDGITIYISDDLDKGVRKYPYMIIFHGKGKGIKNTSCNSSKDSCTFDTVKLNRLASDFLSYEISKLAVDDDNNVFIGVGSGERFNLVRFSDQKFVKDEYKTEWWQVVDNWYVKRD